MSNSLQVDVYVAPAIAAVTGSDDPAKTHWSPISCTLIHGPTSAVLVDTPTTAELAKGLADWVEKTAPGKRLQYIFTTHAHGDHFFGNPILVKRYPDVECVATSFVAEGIKQHLSEEAMARWNRLFPNGQIPGRQFAPKPLPATGEFTIDGHSLFGIDVTYSDIQFSSFLHVPSLRLVVAGDIVYGDCHQHFAEANTTEKRKHWLDALAQIASLKPNIVVPGHKRVSQIDGAYLIDETRNYILTFERELRRAANLGNPVELEKAMKRLYPNRWNAFILDYGVKSSLAKHLAGANKSQI
jgi:glyoxylase-like metal-dependent hydrolase (beta-lactamase superfamily II)